MLLVCSSAPNSVILRSFSNKIADLHRLWCGGSATLVRNNIRGSATLVRRNNGGTMDLQQTYSNRITQLYFTLGQ